MRRISFGARTYNASIGRFDRVDAMADVSRRFSPYTYVYNNPLIIVDPDGNEGDYYDREGNHLGSDGINDDKAYIADSKNANGTFNNAKE